MTISPKTDEIDLRILSLLCDGLSDAAVGRRLGIGHRTVQRRVGRMMTVLGVSGRVALGAKAERLGWFDVAAARPGAAARPCVPAGSARAVLSAASASPAPSAAS
ncbi:helix-turn-helix transcriptional regulator [Streptomyces sp. TRM 70351]|uniref:response regulator transcription factor n=1 Tax=Streptomyces sp. TRM 70351 TaxID=3116552 RepID=UPI002E7C32D9|nr:helix-turn-helix transcriptional regulator [Streptomyces sp. TRM 70351]MEE1927534.1 helix-turn-helix transcriptional regulator [Streptomyces sp. TRM 70351]